MAQTPPDLLLLLQGFGRVGSFAQRGECDTFDVAFFRVVIFLLVSQASRRADSIDRNAGNRPRVSSVFFIRPRPLCKRPFAYSDDQFHAIRKS